MNDCGYGHVDSRLRGNDEDGQTPAAETVIPAKAGIHYNDALTNQVAQRGKLRRCS
ncbi:MAG TPA: hypothetical protein VMX16_17405 [Terriglobia bacterium]|nr:hypothetical protein [Terriglobia bacterium]